jgi:acetyl esterase
MTRIRIMVAALATLVFADAAVAESNLDPAVQQFLDGVAALHQAPLHKRSPEDVRDELERLQSLPIRVASASVHQRFVDGGPSGRTHVHIIRPHGLSGRLPVVVYFHGGEWMRGSFGTHERLVQSIAGGVGATVIFVDYDRTPETKFPIALEQGYGVLKYVAAHAEELNIDADRIAVAGDGAGGTLATAASILARDQKGPIIRSQILLYPITSADFDSQTYRDFGNGPWLTRDDMIWFWEFYLPDHSLRSSIHASPLRASIDQLRGLPPTLVITAEHDMMRDEGERYAQKLANAGVPTVVKRYNGVIHDFMMLNVFATLPSAQAAVGQAIDELRSRLAK